MLVIGNGESRISIDINKLQGPKIGCNAILRDFKVDHLVCVDRPMLQEALNSTYHKNSSVYTRRRNWVQFRLEKNIRMVPSLPYQGSERPDDPIHWGSGPYAVLLAALLATDDIRMIGFDLHSQNDTVNNIYKDTKNYIAASKRPVDPRYWIHQIGKVFKHYPTKKFTIYQDNFELPSAWNHSNVSLDNISNL
tara:strand:- start:47 stop:625 length:579 start_codon:yes stop_codon:yes gene_type:complete